MINEIQNQTLNCVINQTKSQIKIKLLVMMVGQNLSVNLKSNPDNHIHYNV